MFENGLAELKAHSVRWGSDADIVQGAGGNTSFKENGRLVVKASGMRLADAHQREIFVEVDMDAALAMVKGAATPPGANGLRPSIETSLHAVMPHAFVAHVHAVEVLAFAVRADGQAALSPLLDGLRWGWIPYLKPGAAVAAAVAELLEHRPIDVVVLGNHGLVIGGDSCAEIHATLQAIRVRVAATPRGGPHDEARLAELSRRFGLEPARYPAAHLAAVDSTNLGFATAGTLYPDHVVFLGRGAVALPENGPSPSDASLLYLAAGAGALLPKGAPNEAHEMAGCLGAVVARIPAGASLSTLSRSQETELLQWDAETYRQGLAKAHGSAH